MTPLGHLDELERMARSYSEDCGGDPDAAGTIAAHIAAIRAALTPSEEDRLCLEYGRLRLADQRICDAVSDFGRKNSEEATESAIRVHKSYCALRTYARSHPEKPQ